MADNRTGARKSTFIARARLTAVVFDLDGTLVDTRPAVAAAHSAALAAVTPLDHLLGRVPRGADEDAYHRRLGELAFRLP